MLVLNPINQKLFEFGFDGHKDIFEYWTRHKTELLQYLSRKAPKLLQHRYYLIDFEAKLRWRTHMGIVLLCAIEERLSGSAPGSVLDFTTLEARHGKTIHSLKKFSSRHPLNETAASGKADARGIRLIRGTYQDVTIRNADMAYASLNSSRFTRVRFENCRFDYARFGNAELQDCVFDAGCSLDSVDFSDAYVEAAFECPIREPKITVLYKSQVAEFLLGRKPRYIHFSEICGASFIQHCQSAELSNYLPRLQHLLRELYRERRMPLPKRAMMLVKRLLLPLPL